MEQMSIFYIAKRCNPRKCNNHKLLYTKTSSIKLHEVKTKKYENLMNLKCQWETLDSEFVSSLKKKCMRIRIIQLKNSVNKQV